MMKRTDSSLKMMPGLSVNVELKDRLKTDTIP